MVKNYLCCFHTLWPHIYLCIKNVLCQKNNFYSNILSGCCIKGFLPFCPSVWRCDKFSCYTSGKHCMLAFSFFFFFSLRKIELNKCVFCASGSSSAQCSNPFYIFTLVIVLIQNIKCDGVTSYTNRAGFYCYYLEMLYNGYWGSIVLHCDGFG